MKNRYISASLIMIAKHYVIIEDYFKHFILDSLLILRVSLPKYLI